MLPNRDREPVVIPGQTTGCGRSLSLSPALLRLLCGLPDGTEPVEPAVYCELEEGHTGAHYALGQINGPDWWWTRWRDGHPPELVERPPCDMVAVTGGPGEHGVPCALPVGHAGAHGFTRPA